MKDSEIRNAILDAMAAAAEAQLRALRRLQAKPPAEPRPRKRRSNLDMVEDVLLKAGAPLHIGAILEQVEQQHGVRLDRDSVVSALAKKVLRQERFERTAPNTFAPRGGASS